MNTYTFRSLTSITAAQIAALPTIGLRLVSIDLVDNGLQLTVHSEHADLTRFSLDLWALFPSGVCLQEVQT